MSYDDAEISLITVGPGEVYWQAFGHNAILVEDSVSGFNAIYNFGIFDFTSENFFLNFLKGDMTYRMVALEPASDIARYVRDGRRVTQQVLSLTSDEKRRLIEHLEWHRRPENASYAYDYFLQNCSTKVRDALDIALGGALKRRFEDEPNDESFRSSLSDYSIAIPWMHFGVGVALGRAVDQPISRWSLFYLPDDLRNALADFRVLDGQSGFVSQTIELNAPAPKPTSQLTTLIPAMLLALVILWLVLRFYWASLTWAVASGVLGIVLAALWLATSHWATAGNLTILALSPLLLVYAFSRGQGRRLIGIAIIVGGIAAFPFSSGTVQKGIIIVQLVALFFAMRHHQMTAWRDS